MYNKKRNKLKNKGSLMSKTKLYEEYIKNTYIELTELAQSEYGNTYLAKNKGNGMIVVKKQVNIQTGKVYERLRNIKSPYLAQIQEVCFCDDFCIIIESYISGETLEQKLEQSNSLSEEEIDLYSLQILECLSRIHKAGIVHRDLTPSNILISTDNIVKLIDFGIARTTKENQCKDTTILGTAEYAAPEQFGFSQTDGRTDIYAFGIVLNKMLTGILPSEQLTESKKYRKIVEKCIMFEPEKRYQTVEEILSKVKVKNIQKNSQKEDTIIWPGFRSNILWHKIVAITGYAFLLMVIALSISEYGTTIQTFFLECTALFLYIVAPFLIGSNFGKWERKWKPFSSMPKLLTITIRVVVAFLLIGFGLELEDYVKYTLLNLPKP